jgi:hypothetical protein
MQNKDLKIKAKQSKRYPFIAEHRGGPLTKEDHRQLMSWGIKCSEHVLDLLDKNIDKRLTYALSTAKKWESGNAPTGMAMKASLGAHAVARETSNPVLKAVARSIGQTVATAHMADHSLGGAFFALKAVKYAGGKIEKERDWQLKKLSELPPEIAEAVQTMWKKKELDRRI